MKPMAYFWLIDTTSVTVRDNSLEMSKWFPYLEQYTSGVSWTYYLSVYMSNNADAWMTTTWKK